MQNKKPIRPPVSPRLASLTMAPLLHHRLPLPLLLALLLGASSHGAPSGNDTYDPNLCLRPWQPSLCGDVRIHYPFHLHNETAVLMGFEGSYCGYPGLGMRCEEGTKPVLQLGGDNYRVLGIHYINSTVYLADQEVFEFENLSCPRVGHNVTLRDTWLSYPEAETVVYYLDFFLDCNLGMAFSLLNAIKITCPAYEGPRPSFVSLQPGELPYEDWQKECEKIELPVLKNWDWSDTQNSSAWSGGKFGEALRAGFQLVWDLERKVKMNSSCYQCEESKGCCGYNQTGDFVACLCSDGRIGAQNICKGSKGVSGAIIGGVAGGFFALVAGVIAFFIIRRRNLKKGVNSSSKLLKYSGSGGTPYYRDGDTEYGSVQDPPTHLFTYEELEEATDGFNDNRELGDGGFGIVYKGYLKDGRVVAVKKLYNNSYRRMEQFMNEAEILSRLRHPNLVMFYGCTSSTSRELLLVYEFVANGTVADHLHGHRAAERALSWPLRLNIAVEAAAALTYLHAIEQPIVHRDVKTTNILLDADFHVKVADFGLSRLFPLDATHVSTAPQGTPGYVDPEYHQCYQLTDKSDVYSFGVVLVELISSKPAVDITRHRNEINLAGMAVNKIQKCQLEELVDLELGFESDPATKKMMTMVAELAFRCLQQNGDMRPPIKEVFEVLRSIQGECRMEKGGDKDKDNGPFSPNTVQAPWDSRATTPNTSRD